MMAIAKGVLDHLLGDVEIGDHAVPQRSDGADLARRAANHLFGFLANGEKACAAVAQG